MTQGRVIEHGTHEQLLRAKGAYHRLLVAGDAGAGDAGAGDEQAAATLTSPHSLPSLSLDASLASLSASQLASTPPPPADALPRNTSQGAVLTEAEAQRSLRTLEKRMAEKQAELSIIQEERDILQAMFPPGSVIGSMAPLPPSPPPLKRIGSLAELPIP
jgi:hypothetical protein